jgi:hypothetical protein
MTVFGSDAGANANGSNSYSDRGVTWEGLDAQGVVVP